MSKLTWVPREMRAMIESIDPAAGITATGKARVSDIIATATTTATGTEAAAPAGAERESGVEDAPRFRRRTVLAPLGAVLLVVVAAIGVLLGRSGSGSTPQPAAPSPSAHSTAPATIPQAAPPPVFPVDATPRPIVLLGESVDVSGFPNDDSKIAFMDGKIDLATALPRTPESRSGYPIVPAARAVRQITDVHSCCVITSTRLRIATVRLIDYGFRTDRGTQSLPAWRIRFAGLPTDVTVLAVAPSARYPSKLGSGQYSSANLTSSDHGRKLTIFFVAHHASKGYCDTGYRSVLSMSQSSSAVRISVRIVEDRPSPATSPPPNTFCAYAAGGGLPAPPGSLKPGTPNTRTITLNAPLGRRLVVDARNHPYAITNGG